MGEASIRLTRGRWQVVALAAYQAMMVSMTSHFADQLNLDGVVPGRSAGR